MLRSRLETIIVCTRLQAQVFIRVRQANYLELMPATYVLWWGSTPTPDAKLEQAL